MSPINTGFVGPAVATALTVYGIETIKWPERLSIINSVATALTVYGIETSFKLIIDLSHFVATALTVYGIETLINSRSYLFSYKAVATALTVYGIETRPKLHRYIVDPE